MIGCAGMPAQRLLQQRQRGRWKAPASLQQQNPQTPQQSVLSTDSQAAAPLAGKLRPAPAYSGRKAAGQQAAATPSPENAALSVGSVPQRNGGSVPQSFRKRRQMRCTAMQVHCGVYSYAQVSAHVRAVICANGRLQLSERPPCPL